MKTFYMLLITAIILCSCSNSSKPKPNNEVVDKLVTKLKLRKDAINEFSRHHKNNMLVFAKLPNKEQAVRIENEKWPENTECAYNVLKDKDGHVIMIMSSPVSESGDWNFEATHYFDKYEHTFIYEIKANAFTLPDDGVAYETTTQYFDPAFKSIRRKYKLVDKDGKALDKKSYGFDAESRGFDTKAYANVKGCLTAYHINL